MRLEAALGPGRGVEVGRLSVCLVAFEECTTWSLQTADSSNRIFSSAAVSRSRSNRFSCTIYCTTGEKSEWSWLGSGWCLKKQESPNLHLFLRLCLHTILETFMWFSGQESPSLQRPLENAGQKDIVGLTLGRN